MLLQRIALKSVAFDAIKKTKPTLSVHSVACRGQNDVSFEA